MTRGRFSSGIVLWESLAGRRLFKADHEAATLTRVMSEPIPRLADVAQNMDAAVSDVVMKALERDRSKRFATCAQFADALQRAASGKGGLADPRELAKYVSDVVGTDIEAQRDAVRQWLAQSEPSRSELPHGPQSSRPPPLSGIVSTSALGIPGDPKTPSIGNDPGASAAGASTPLSRDRRVIAAGAALLLLLGVVVIFAVSRSGSAAHPESATAAATPTTQPKKPIDRTPEPATPPTAEPPASVAAPTATEPAVATPKPKSTKPGVARPQPKGDEPDLSNPYR